VLLDSWSDSQYGGTGRRFDWQLLKNIEKPLVFLAGGITPENFPEVKKLYSYAIDISSGIEKYPGKKDRTKLKQLFTGAL
jgi:phosphoribosylanthranilate isomerase